jgi:hypothetical protein
MQGTTQYFVKRFLLTGLRFSSPDIWASISLVLTPHVLEAALRIRIRIRSRMYLGLLDTDPDPLVREMDLDPFYYQANIVRKTLIPTVCDFFLFFVSVLKINDENSRIRIRIWIHTKMSWIRNTGPSRNHGT